MYPNIYAEKLNPSTFAMINKVILVIVINLIIKQGSLLGEYLYETDFVNWLSGAPRWI